MTGLKIILAATDFSRSAVIAVSRAAQLARAAHARLELMHVMPPEPVSTGWTAVRDAFGFDWVRARDDAMDRLRNAEGRIQAEFALRVELELAEGKPHQKIAARAIEIGADLIVVGAHGEHFVLDVFTGTTAQRVQRFSAVPVLVVRQAPIHRYEQVLVATDFSVAAAAAARAALRFFPGATFHVLHIFDAPFAGRLAYAGVEKAAIEDYRQQVGDQARRELATFIRETGLLGSVTEHVAAESHADVLLVRPPM